MNDERTPLAMDPASEIWCQIPDSSCGVVWAGSRGCHSSSLSSTGDGGGDEALLLSLSSSDWNNDDDDDVVETSAGHRPTFEYLLVVKKKQDDRDESTTRLRNRRIDALTEGDIVLLLLLTARTWADQRNRDPAVKSFGFGSIIIMVAVESQYSASTDRYHTSHTSFRKCLYMMK